VPVQATFALTAGYPIPINDKLTIEAGAAFTFTPVPYTLPASRGCRAEQDRAAVRRVANGGVTYEVAPKIGVRGDSRPWLAAVQQREQQRIHRRRAGDRRADDVPWRAALSVSTRITPNIVIAIPSVAFSYSPPKDGLASDIKSITSIDFMLGIGYRM